MLRTARFGVPKTPTLVNLLHCPSPLKGEGQCAALMTGLCFGVIDAGFREASQFGRVLRC